MAIRLKTITGGTPPPAAGPSTLRKLLAGGVRVGSGLLASVPGAVPGVGTGIAAAIGGIGEMAAENIEGSPYNPARIGVEAGLAAVPFGKLISAGKAARSAIQSGLMTGAGEAGREWASGEEFSPSGIGLATLLGGASGGLIGKFAGGKPAADPKSLVRIDTTAQRGGQTMGGGKIVIGGRTGLIAGAERPTALTGGKVQQVIPPDSIHANMQRAPRVEPDLPTGSFSEVNFNRPQTPPLWEPDASALRRELDDIARMSGEAPTAAAPSKADMQLNSWMTQDELLDEQNAANLARMSTSGLKRKTSVGETLTAMTPEGATRRLSTRFVRPKAKAATEAPPAAAAGPATVGAGQPSLQALIAKLFPQTAAEPATPSNLVRETAEGAPQVSIDRVMRVVPPTAEDGLEGFGPSGVPPVGLGRFLGVQQPLESPRAPRAPKGPSKTDLKIENSESMRLLKDRIAQEQTGRPAKFDAYPPEVVQELDRLGGLYRTAQGAEKRGLGAQLQELRMFMSGQNAKGQPYVRDEWRGAVPRQVPTGVPAAPAAPAVPDWVQEESGIVDQLKKMLGGQGGGRSETGSASTELLTHLGAGAIGAGIGAMTDPFDDPLTSAGAGFVAGAAAPSVFSALKSIGLPDEATATVSASLPHPDAPAIDATKVKQTASQLWELLPQVQRFNYLASNGIIANAFVGPLGSAMFGALEHGLSGDARGWRVFKEMMDPAFWGDLKSARKQAIELIQEGEIGRAESSFLKPNDPFGNIIQAPGVLMTTGDVAARRLLMKAGFTDDEARMMTLTSEPEFKLPKNIANMGRGERDVTSGLLDLMFPFKRTPANSLEQGALRVPILGSILQANRAVPDSIKQQMWQQGLGLGIGGVSAGIGYNMPPETARTYRRYVTNAAGQYGLPSAIGFGAGQALRAGENPVSGGLAAGIQGIPIPATDTLDDWRRFIFSGGGVPRGAYPAILREEPFKLGASDALPKPTRIRIRRPQ